jgi:hypothetical protein
MRRRAGATTVSRVPSTDAPLGASSGGTFGAGGSTFWHSHTGAITAKHLLHRAFEPV